MVDRPYTSVWDDLREVEFSQGFLQAGPYRTRYLHAGDESKPALLMLHGITGHAEAYVRNLAAHAEHFSCWAIDFIGHGYSSKPRHPLEIPHYLDQIDHVLDAIGVEKAFFTGESLGGWVTARFAQLHPRPGGEDRAQHHGRHDGQPAGHAAPLHPVDGGGEGPVVGAGQGPPGMADGRPRDGHRRPDPDPSGDLPAARLARRLRGQHGAADPAIRRRNMLSDDDLRAIAAPALVLWTTKDPSGPVDEARRIASLIPNAQLAVMDNCGHWPQ